MELGLFCSTDAIRQIAKGTGVRFEWVEKGGDEPVFDNPINDPKLLRLAVRAGEAAGATADQIALYALLGASASASKGSAV